MKTIKNRPHYNLMSVQGIQLDQYKSTLDEQIMMRGVKFETRDIPISPYPYIVSSEVSAKLDASCSVLHRVVEKVVSQYKTDTKIQGYMNLHKKFHDLVLKSPVTKPCVMFCRFDFCLVDSQMKLYEVNSACPAGLQISRDVYSAYVSSDIINDLNINYNLGLKAFPVNIQDSFTMLVKAALKETDIKFDKSLTVGLLNSKHNTMINELKSFKQELNREDINCEIGFVEDVEYRDGSMFLNQKRVDACFQKFDNNVHSDDYQTAFSKNKEEVADYIQAVEDNAVIQINPFSSMFVGESKTLLALIKEPSFNYLFDEEELKVIEEVVPDTRKCSDENVKMAVAMKDDWILKRSLDTRGRNVIIGRECSQHDWQLRLEQAAVENADYVLQHCHIAEKSTSYYTTQALFMIAGKPIGMISRTSANKVTNVGKNGFVQLTLLC